MSNREHTENKYLNPAVEQKPSLKIAWSVGKNTVVVIDSQLVKHLGITEHETMFEQSITEGGILMKIKRREDQ